MLGRGPNHCLLAWFAVAFGTGLILALFCSLRFVLILAALILIILGLILAC